MRRTASTLSDGRDIIYFDADGAPDRNARDTRELPAEAARSELRWDAVLDEWVIVAAHRQGRTFQPAAEACPLCPTAPGRPSEVPASDYDVVVFENRFPALTAPARQQLDGLPDAAGLLVPPAPQPGTGRCEVVCFAADHHTSFAHLTADHAELVVAAWIDRTRALLAQRGVRQVFCFENRGREIGVTLSHPHGQIYAYPFLTPRTTRMVDVARAWSRRHGRDLVDVVTERAFEARARVVARSDCWTAFVPFAARWPYEVHLYPHRRVPDLAGLHPVERRDFVLLYLDVLRRFDALFSRPAPYISAVHQAPPGTEDALSLHVEVFSTRRAEDKLKFLAGSEAAMGVFSNDVSPETAARRLRDAA